MKTAVSPFYRFIRVETSGGIIVLIVAIIALVSVNTSLSSAYNKLFITMISLKVGDFQLTDTLTHWINSGLMTIFFFVAGLEIKREVMLGELSSYKKASLPVFAAVGGSAIPALLYTLLNKESITADAWVIPTVTDIAICFFIISLLGNRVPFNLKIFVFAFAIAGNLLSTAVTIIINYSDINLKFLLIGLGLYLYLIIFNILKIRFIHIYLIFGLIIWYMFLRSGIHPVIAGIFIAFTIPKERKIRTSVFRKRMESNLQEFASDERKSKVELTDKQLTAIDNIVAETGKVKSPLQYLEHKLHGFVSYFVLPFFVLANAGIFLNGSTIEGLTNPLTQNISISLFLGKLTGVFVFSWLAVVLKLAVLPTDIKWIHILGAGFLGGIGLSISLFINELIGVPANLENQVKTGIYLATVFSAVFGFLILRLSLKNKKIT